LGQVFGRMDQHGPAVGEGKMLCTHDVDSFDCSGPYSSAAERFCRRTVGIRTIRYKTIIGKENGFVKTQNHDRSVVFRYSPALWRGTVSAPGWDRPAGRRPPPAFQNRGPAFGTAARGGW